MSGRRSKRAKWLEGHWFSLEGYRFKVRPPLTESGDLWQMFQYCFCGLKKDGKALDLSSETKKELLLSGSPIAAGVLFLIDKMRQSIR